MATCCSGCVPLQAGSSFTARILQWILPGFFRFGMKTQALPLSGKNAQAEPVTDSVVNFVAGGGVGPGPGPGYRHIVRQNQGQTQGHTQRQIHLQKWQQIQGQMLGLIQWQIHRQMSDEIQGRNQGAVSRG